MRIDPIFTCDLLRPPLTGIGYYTAHLISELLERGDCGGIAGLAEGRWLEKQALEQRLAATLAPSQTRRATSGNPLAKWAGRCGQTLPPLGTALRALRLRRYERLLASVPGRLLHAPDFIAPPHRGPTVITVHDLSHIRYPETHPRERVAWLNRQLSPAIERADRVICISEFTRNELLELGLTDDSEKLRVCYNGCDAGFHPRSAEAVASALARWGLEPSGYILSVATLEPRKNLEMLLEAYNRLPAALAHRFPLVLAGSPGWRREGLEGKIAASRHPVIVTGYLERGTLQKLFSGARLFAFLSLYEGFGLPVVEAMASGVPVLCSAPGALEEVAGDCSYTVDPTDCDAIVQGLTSLLEDDQASDGLRRKGLARAAMFTWQRCAADTVEVYRSALARQE